MKILLLQDSAYKKCNNDYSVELSSGLFAKELQEVGNQVTFYGQHILVNQFINEYEIIANGLNIVSLKQIKNKLLNYLFLYIYIIPQIVKNDYVYIYYPTSFKFVPILCGMLNKPYGLYVRSEKGVLDKVAKYNYKNAHAVFTVSDMFSKSINNIVNYSIANTIRPMIPFTESNIIHKTNIQLSDKLKVLFLGRVTRDKGVKELINAIWALKNKNYSLELTIVGDGGFLNIAKQMITDLYIEDIVFIKGAIFEPDRIREEFTKSDIYILPSYHEGFPRTLYESMIFGVPIITTFVGTIPALMQDGYNCKEITPKSVDSIVEAVEFAINNYEDMILYANNATKTVEPIVDSKRLSHAQHLNMLLETI